MILSEILGGLLTGVVGGFVSGLLGVTSGGILVPLLILILGSEQHVAQGISLVAQIVPTSLSGVQQYRRSGHRTPLAWVLWLAAGFCLGGSAGALLANTASDRFLRWTFVGYLLALEAIILFRTSSKKAEKADGEDRRIHWLALLAIGACAGMSSGFLGIGGGLAITALMTAALKVSQHQSQALSLAVTALPVTLPAAWLYAQHGEPLPWAVIASVIVGLWAGTTLGSLSANRIDQKNLRRALIGMIAAMIVYMSYKAMS
jgi:uncharacterized protein